MSTRTPRPSSMRSCGLLVLAAILGCVVGPAGFAGPLFSRPAWATQAGAASSGDFKAAVDKGTRWLVARQNPDGGYGPYGDGPQFRVKNASDVGITAFVLYAIARNPRGYTAVDGPYISKAVDLLLSRQQPDGGVYDPKDPTLQNYRTSVAVLALTALDRVKYREAVQRAQGFIKEQQFSASKGYDPKQHVSYGGIGYGSALRGDLSNTQLGAEALAESGLSGSDELWQGLTVFVTRCLNAEEVDPLLRGLGIGTTKDGGARYAPNETRGPAETLDDGVKVFSSYGSMSYAALKSLLYAKVSKDDPRVQGLIRWISGRFNVAENPGMATQANPRAGQNGLYYYYHTMAKTLYLNGDAVLKDSKGVAHRWAEELGSHIVGLQKEDGSWLNATGRWFEDIPELDTAYAMVALVDCLSQLEREAGQPAAGPAGAPAPAAK